MPGGILTLSAETHRAFMGRYAGYHQARRQSMEGEEALRTAELLDCVCRSLPYVDLDVDRTSFTHFLDPQAVCRCSLPDRLPDVAASMVAGVCCPDA
jgi:hypothetical protein